MAHDAFLSDVLHISAETNRTVKDILLVFAPICQLKNPVILTVFNSIIIYSNALKGETTRVDWKSATELK